MLSSEASTPILWTVSAVAPLRDLCIPSLKAESLYVFNRVYNSQHHCSNDTSPLAIFQLKIHNFGMFVLRPFSLIKLCKTDDTSLACTNEATKGFGTS